MLTKDKVETMSGAQVLVETLKNLGVGTVFGYPGGMVLDVYDELYLQNDIKHFLVRHEQAAIHSAEGYAKISGKCGVVLVTSGPGATNTITGIVNAYLDGTPVVILCGQVSVHQIGKDAFQEANICDMTKSCTKKTFQVTNAQDIQKVLTEAFIIANSGKKGPVVVDLPKNIFKEQIIFDNDIKFIENNKRIVSNVNLSELRLLLEKCERPVIVAGGGVKAANAQKELGIFAKKYSIPVVSTMMGLGTYPQNSDNYFGMIGIFGQKCANEIIKKSDLIINLGSRFNDRITCVFDKNDLDKKIIQVDINQNELSRVITPICEICADIKDVLKDINLKLQPINFSAWLNKAQSMNNINIKRKRTSNMLHSFEVLQELENYTKDKSVIFTTEVGQHQLWAIENLTFDSNNRPILVSGGAGTMGYGLPAAIGAAIASPEKTIVCVTGDGSFQMTLHELATIKDYNLNIKILIMNNGYLGMVRQLQEKNCQSRYSQTRISNPDFVKLANSYSIESENVTTQSDFKQVLQKIFANKSPHVTNIIVEPMEVL